jgi:hypothetical protein
VKQPEGWREGKKSTVFKRGKQGAREEEKGDREEEQQSQEGGGEKAMDERLGERRSDRQCRSEGQECWTRETMLPKTRSQTASKTAVVT